MANYARLILAVLWTAVWGYLRWCRNCLSFPRWTVRQSRRFGFTWSGFESPKAMRCRGCGWAGPLRWARRSYDHDTHALCPDCRGGLEPVLRRRDGCWAS